MRILELSKSKDKGSVEKLIRREPLVTLKGVGSRASLTKKVFGKALTPEQAVERIVEDVRKKGDAALFSYTRKLDGFAATPQNIQVTKAEIQKALDHLEYPMEVALRTTIRNVRFFHTKEKPARWFHNGPQMSLGQRWTALDRVGLYVPGGLAAYPSSVIMNVIPAKVAGVKEVIVVTPVKKDGQVNPIVLAAAYFAGADRILKIGGAQAVAALAYGTKSVPAVDKITGPGNLFVALAKRRVFGQVGIDGFPGPSEVLILADGTAPAAWAAADLLAQAEHDEMAMPLMVTTSSSYAKEVAEEVELQLEMLDRRQIASDSLKSRGAILVVKNKKQAEEFANRYAAEHLELLIKDARSWLPNLRHAGALFIGPHSAEAFGDYTAGTNHVLPTGGTARFSSGLSVFDFLKRTNMLEMKKPGVKALGKATVDFANEEGLGAHAQSVLFRMGKSKD
ncbi:MAG TPA: histidinol dehydrogenase [bacterium]|nr:histidinol dehydrogenase [bacterium]